MQGNSAGPSAASPYGPLFGDGQPLPPNRPNKVFIQRDYTDGTNIKFNTSFPSELEGRIDQLLFQATVEQLNELYAEAENFRSRTYCENCFACMTAYLVFLCMETYYEKVLKKISRFIQDENEKVYGQHGLILIDPVERGLRVIEICIVENESRHR